MKDAIAELIGKYLAAKRTERELTQEQLAVKVGITRQNVSMLERGVHVPGWDTLYLLAEVLRCEVFDLLPTTRQARHRYERRA